MERILRMVLAVVVLTGIGIVGPELTVGETEVADAADPFPERFSTNANGAIDMIGNTVVYCRSISFLNAANPGTCTETHNQQGNMQRVDADLDLLTYNSSSADLSLDDESEVLWAGLYWLANSSSSARSSMWFKAPGDLLYRDIDADQLLNSGNNYRGFADVTDIVRDAGAGSYWGANISSTTGSGAYGVWSVVVVYENPAEPMRNLTVYDGLATVSNNNNQTLTFSGFLTPPNGDVVAEVGVMAGEGDLGITGDRLQLKKSNGNAWTDLSDNANPPNNYFNSSITDNGVDLGGRTPAVTNNFGIDIDETLLTNEIANSAVDAQFRFTSSGDAYFPAVVTFAVNLYVPVFTSTTKTVTDLNGGNVEPGDQLEYTVNIRNTGDDPADLSTIVDPIPDDTSLVPGSIQVTNVDNTTVNATDADDGDLAEFDGTNVIARVGSGANGTSGGTIGPGDTVTLRFRVSVADSAAGTTVRNRARVDYRARTLGDDVSFPTPTAAVYVPPLARMSVDKTAQSPVVIAGESATWTIDVSNDGPNPATQVRLTDTLPAGMTFESATNATCSGTNTVTCDLTDIDAGDTVEVTLVAEVDPSIPHGTTLTNGVQVSAFEYDDDTSDDTSAATVTINRTSDLTVTKSDDPDPVVAGESVVYTIEVINDGPSVATDVIVTESAPAGTTATSFERTAGEPATCSSLTRCDIAELNVGESATFAYEVDVDEATTGTLTNTVNAYIDETGDTGSASEDTTVTPLADIKVVKQTTDAPVVAGEPVNYEIVVSNEGPSPASAVNLIDAFDNRLTGVSVSTTVGSCSIGAPNPANYIECALGTLTSGSSATINVSGTVPGNASGNLANSAAATTTTDEPATGDEPNAASVTDTIVNRADLSIVKEVDSNPIVAGTNFEYTITVTNHGPSTTDGSNIVVTDVVPAPMQVSSVTTPGCSSAPGNTNEVTCTSNAALGVNDTLTYTISGSVPAGADPAETDNEATVAHSNDPNAANDSSLAESDVVNDADVGIVKTWQDDEVTAGESTTFTTTVTNIGPSVAHGVVVTDPLPSGVTFDSLVAADTTPGVTCSGTTTITCSLGDMGSGASIDIAYTVDVGPQIAAGPLSNTASARSQDGSGAALTPDRNPDNNTSTDSIIVNRSADITMTKVADMVVGGPTIEAGDPIAGELYDYVITVTNNGPSSGTAVVLGDSLPAELEVQTPLPNGCSMVGGILECDLGDIAPGATETLRYTVMLDPSTAEGTSLTNTAQVSSTTPDPTPPTTTSTVTTDADADLGLEKTASATTATPGGPLNYTIKITNDGPSDAVGLDVDDTLPAGYHVTGVSTTAGTCDSSVHCDIDRLAPGDEIDITMTGTVDAGVTASSITNEATVTASTDDPNDATNGTDNNTDDVTVGLAPSSQLVVGKSADVSSIHAGGGPVSYAITVTNNGPSDAQAVELTDTLPAGFVVQSAVPSQGTCAPSGESCDLGTVTPGGAPARINIVGHFPADTPAGTVTNTADVTTTTPLAAGSSASASADVDITVSADLSLTKVTEQTRTSAALVAGQTVTWTLGVGQTGPSIAEQVTVTDTVDTSIVDASSITATVSNPSAGSCTVSPAGVVSCDLDTVTVNEPIAVTVSGVVLASADTGDGPLVNTARIESAATPDPNDATNGIDNNAATASDPIVRRADLSVAKSGPAELVAGRPATYTIDVSNLGPSDAANVVVSDPTPANMTLTIDSGPCDSFPCTIPTLAAGDTSQFSVTGTVNADSTTSDVTNIATVTSDETDPTEPNESSVTSTVTTEADVVAVSKRANPATATAGETLNYTIEVRNDGPSTARSVELVDDLPAGVTFQSATSGCTESSGTVTCDLGDLLSGASRTIGITVMVNTESSGDLANSATVTNTVFDPNDSANGTDNNTTTLTTPIDASADLGIVKTAEPSTVTPGEQITYELVVTNAGPSNALNVVVDDDVSSLLEPGSVSVDAPAGVSCDLTVRCEIADLTPGEITIEITGDANSDLTGSIANTATVSSDTDEPDDATLPNSATATSPTAPSADLTVGKLADVGPDGEVAPGEPITYSISVGNGGPSDAVNVTVDDILPNNITVTSITPSANCDTLTGDCTFDRIEAGTLSTITIEANVNTDAVASIDNVVTIESDTADPDDDSNRAETSTPVTPHADLSVTKTTTTTDIIAGRPIDWQITVMNDGPATAEAVEVTDDLPSGTTFVSASAAPGSCTEASGTVSCSLGDLADGASSTISIRAFVDADNVDPITNTASATTTTTDPDPANNSDSSGPDDVTVEPDLRVIKELAVDPLIAGTTYEYDITILNDGPSDATSVVLTDDFPADDLNPPTITISPATAGSCTGNDPILCEFPDGLDVGDSITVELNGTVPPDTTSVFDNQVTVAAPDDSEDPANLSNNVATAEADLEIDSDLVMTKEFAGDPAEVTAGTATSFELTVQNRGPSDSQPFDIADAVPSGMTVTGIDNTTDCSYSATLVTCDALELDAGPTPETGETFSVTVTVLIDPAQPVGPLNNTATANTTAGTDRNQSNNTDTDTVAVNRSTALTLDKSETDDSAPAIAGSTKQFTLTVGSSGPSTAEDVVVVDSMPDGYTLVTDGLDARCESDAGSLRCELGDIAPGAPVTITYTVAIGPDVDVDTVIRNTAEASTITPNGGRPTSSVDTTVTAAADIELTDKSVTPSTVSAGNTVVYSISGTNNGPSVGRDVTITDPLPAGLTIDPASLPAGCVDDGGTLRCDLGDIAVDQTFAISFTAAVDEAIADGTTVTNTATASATTGDPVTNNERSATLTVEAEADLGITKSADRSTAVPGEQLVYELEVINAGPSTAVDVSVTDDISAIFGPGVSVAADAPLSCDSSVSCTATALAVGAYTITVTGEVQPAIVDTLSNTATITSSTDEPSDANRDNSATLTTSVAPSADLSVAKLANVGGDAEVAPGEPISYSIAVANSGPSDATSVIVADTLPDNITVTTISGPGATCSVATGVCEFASIAAGTMPTITITATVDDDAVGTIANTVSVDSDTPDPDGGNNESSTTTTVTPHADLSIIKRTVTTNIVAGEPLRYELDITNDGPAPATDVVITDTLPNGVTYVNAAAPNGTCGHAAGVVACELDQLAADGDLTVIVDVLVDADTRNDLTNAAEVTSATTDPDPSDNEHSVGPATVTVEPDLRVRKELAQGDLVAGSSEYEYTITIDNDGPSDASRLTVTDNFPPELDDPTISTDPAALVCSGTGTISCELPAGLAVGEQATITLSGNVPAGTTVVADNVVTVAAPDDDEADLSDNTASSSADIEVNSDIEVTKTFTADTVEAGTTTTFDLSVTNLGPSDSQPFTLTDELPAGFDVTALSQPGCSENDGKITCDDLTLAVDDVFVVTVTVAVDPTLPFGSVDNTATAAIDGDTDRNPSNNTDTDSIVVERRSDLTIDKSTVGSGNSATAGNTQRFTVRVSTTGPSSAEDVVVTDPMPDGYTLVVGSLPAGCESAGGDLRCELGTLAPSEEVSISYSVLIDDDSTDGATITNTASASSITPGIEPSDDVDTTIATSADVELIAKTVSPDPAVAGADLEYTITGINHGPSIARSVMLTDAVPGGLTVAQLPTNCSLVAGIVECDLGDIGVNEAFSVQLTMTVDASIADGTTITNTANASSDTSDPVANNRVENEVTTTSASDLGVTKVADKSTAVPGDDLSYELTIVNHGPSTALDVSFADDISEIFDAATVVVDAPAAFTCDRSVSCTADRLLVGSSTLTITGEVLADITSPITNEATVTSDTPQPPDETAPDEATVTTPVAPSANLSIVKVANVGSDGEVTPGERFTYTITVDNDGPSDAFDVVIDDAIPANITVESIVGDTATCDAAGTCEIGVIRDGMSAAITITAVANTDALDEIHNTVTVSADTNDPDPSDNTSETISAVTPHADLSVVKTTVTDPADIIAGQPIRYEIALANSGPVGAPNATITDTLPAGVSFVAASIPGGECSATGGVVTCSVPNLSSGGAVTATIDASIDAGTTGAITNSATVMSDITDPNPDNDTATSGPHAVTVRPDLRIRKELTQAHLVAGESSYEYTITIENDGPSNAGSVTVEDTFPSTLGSPTITTDPSTINCSGTTNITCDLPDGLAVGSVATITLAGSVPAGTTTVDDNLVSVSTLDDEQNLANNAAASSAELEINSDLLVSKEWDAATAAAGTTTSFSLAVDNLGPSDSQPFTLTDTVPAGMSVTAVDNTDCGFDAASVTCADIVLAANASFVVNVDVAIAADQPLGTLSNTATAPAADDTDRNPSNNTDTATIDIVRRSDLTIEKTDTDPGTDGVAGGTKQFTISVGSDGPSTAESVEVVDEMPDGYQLIDSSLDPRCVNDAGDLRCSLGDLAPGAMTTMTYSVTVAPDVDGGSQIVNTATATSITPGTNPTSSVTTDIVTEADVELSSKTVAPNPVVAGNQLTYTIVGINNGPSIARSVVITDPIDPALTIGALPSGCAFAAGTVTCELGDIAVGASFQIELSATVDSDVVDGTTIGNTAAVSADTVDPNTSNDAASTDVTVNRQADLAVSKEANTAVATPGESLRYTVTVSNSGPSVAETITVTDDVTAIFEPGSVIVDAPAGYTCDSSVTCTVPELEPGDSTITIDGTVRSELTNDLENTVTVSASTPEPPGSTGPNSSTITTDVSPIADLAITKVAPTEVAPGDPIRFTIEVTNLGPSDATNLAVVDALPANITVATMSPAAQCSASTGECTLGRLAVDDTVTILIDAVVDSTAVGRVENSVTVSSDTVDDSPSNNSANTQTTVTAFADLTVAKQVVTPAADIVAGQPMRYQLTVTNEGPAAASDVEIVDDLPAGVELIAASASHGSCTESGGVVTCSADQLAAGATIVVDIDVLVETDTRGTLTNTAVASSDTIDPDRSDNEATTGPTSVNTAADLRITKDLTQDHLLAGDSSFEYVVTVDNDGPSDATDVVVTDDFPDQLDPSSVTPSRSASCTTDDPYVCELDAPLAAGDSFTITFLGTTPSSITTIDDNVTAVTSADADPDTSNNTATSSADLSTQADLRLDKAWTTTTVIAGSTAGFRITVTNGGPSDASDVEITDSLPAGFTVTSISATGNDCSNTADTLECTIDLIAADSTYHIDVVGTLDSDMATGPLDNTATVSSQVVDGDPTNNTDTATTSVQRSTELTIDKRVVDTGNPATAGQQKVFEVEVGVAGPSTAETVRLTDPLPEGYQLVTGGLDARCSGAGNVLDCALGTMAVGASEIITYTVEIDADVDDAETLRNTASATSVTPGNSPVSDSVDTVIGTEADVSLTSKMATPNPVVAGTATTFTINGANAGPSAARNVVITDPIDSRFTVVESSLPAGCAMNATTVRCELGNVAPNGTFSVSFDATADPLVNDDSNVDNTASVVSDTSDPNDGNNQASTSIGVEREADLSVSKSAEPSPATPGEPVTYTITVTNAGPAAADEVVVIDDAPAGLAIDSDSITAPTGWTCAIVDDSADPMQLSCTTSEMEPGVATLTFSGTPAAGSTNPLVNDVSVSSDTPQPAGAVGPDDFTLTTPVTPRANLSIEKVANSSPFEPGSAVSWTITVVNDGPSIARDVVVTDEISDAVSSLAAPGCDIVDQAVTCTIGDLGVGRTSINISGLLAQNYTGNLVNVANVESTTPEASDSPPNQSTTTTPTEPTADVRLVKSASPDPVLAGEMVTYVLAVTNDGPSAATGVTVGDALPEGLSDISISSTQGACTVFPCTLGTLANGTTAQITLTATVDSDRLSIDANSATVTIDGTVVDPDPSNNTDTAAPEVTTAAELTVTKVLGSETAVPGTDLSWLITVRNVGPSDARNVAVADSLPDEIENAVLIASQGSCTATACNLGILGANESASITVTADLPASVSAGTLVNEVTVTSDTPGEPASTTSTDPIVPTADLSIEKTGPATVTAGTSATWTLDITNSGPSDATQVVITDELPGSVIASSIVASGDGTCETDGLVVTCTIARLAVGSAAAIEISAQIDADSSAQQVENEATVASEATDPDPTNNSDAISSGADARADLTVTPLTGSSAGPRSTEVAGAAGAAGQVRFLIGNNGPSSARDTTVTIPIPDGVEISTVEVPDGMTVTVSNSEIIVAAGRVISGGDFEITIDYTSDPGLFNDLSGTTPGGVSEAPDFVATASSTTPDANGANSSANTILNTTYNFDIDFDKTVVNGTVDYGESISYTLSVTNGGPSDSIPLVVADQLPEQLSIDRITGANCTIDEGSNSARCEPVIVAAGSTATFTVTANATAGGEVSNTARVACADSSQAELGSGCAPTTATATITVDQNSDLRLSKSADRGAVELGGIIAYELTVTNEGPHPASGVRVIEDLPIALDFISAAGGDYDEETATWIVGDLAVGETASLTLTAMAGTTGEVVNRISVVAATGDPTINDEIASASVVVQAELPETGSNIIEFIKTASGLVLAGAVLLIGLWFNRRQRQSVTR